jgi:hypothetical protein
MTQCFAETGLRFRPLSACVQVASRIAVHAGGQSRNVIDLLFQCELAGFSAVGLWRGR